MAAHSVEALRIDAVERSIERRLSALIESGLALSSDLDIDTLLQRTADLAREVIGARYAAVGELGADGQLVRFIYSGIEPVLAQEIGNLPTGLGLLGVLIEQAKPLRLKEISAHPRYHGLPPHHPPMHSFLGVPILIRGQAFGRLYLTEKIDFDEFTGQDEQIAQLFASQAGVAIENARLYAEVRERSESLARRLAQLSSVELIGRLIITDEGVNRTLRSVVEEAMALTHSRSSILMLLDEDTGDLVARVARGALSEAVDIRIPKGTSKAHGVMERMKGEAVEDLSADPEVHDKTWRKLLKPKRGAFAPLVVRGGSVGVLAVYDPSGGEPFSDDEVNVLQMLANQAAIALENERMTEALRVLAILEERERISKELHDGVIQAIYSVGLSLQGTTQIIGRDPVAVGERIETAIGELDEVVRDLRSYIFHLRPRSVEERGLESAIRELARDLEVNTIAHVEVQLDAGAGAGLSEADQIHVIQIVREILSNIARHSRASEVEITMTANADHILLKIDDDGVTFEPDRVVAGHGLRNVDERARALGGVLQIVGRNPKGMRHAVDIPIRRGQ